MKTNNCVLCLSLTYNACGHSKDYIDSFLDNVGSGLDISIFVYGKTERDKVFGCSGDVNFIQYNANQRYSEHRKIIRRFFSSIKLFLYFLNKTKYSKCPVYFMDYEYLSLALFLLFFLRGRKKYILLHSVSSNEKGVKGSYKALFFKLLSWVGEVEYIVNGDKALKEIKSKSNRRAWCIQYPTELKCTVVPKETAKAKLGFRNETVISILGMIRSDKNYKEAFCSFANSKLRNSSECKLLVAGFPSNITEEQILLWLKKYNILNYKLLPRYLSDDELSLCFSATDVLLVPYGAIGTSQSGPLSQARLYHVPAIVQSGGEIGDYVKREKIGITFDRFPKLTTLFDELDLSTLNYDFTTVNEKYSWSNAADQYISILK